MTAGQVVGSNNAKKPHCVKKCGCHNQWSNCGGTRGNGVRVYTVDLFFLLRTAVRKTKNDLVFRTADGSKKNKKTTSRTVFRISYLASNAKIKPLNRFPL